MRLLQIGCCVSFTMLIFLLFLKSKATYAIDAMTKDDMEDLTGSEGIFELKGRLVFAHVLYRHGDRMPIEPYPTDPWKNAKFWPAGWGQLTNIGKMQQYHLGQWIRKRYKTLLSSKYSSDNLYVRSTDVDRTLMSALSNLAGLYPPKGDDVWNGDFPWQPIPVHTRPDKIDATLGKAPCAAYEHALSELLTSPEFKKINERYSYLYHYLTKYTGSTISSLEMVQRINNTLLIEELYNKTLPEWTKRVYPSPDMTYISKLFFKIPTQTRKMARLKAGPFVKEVLERFDHKAKNKLIPDRNVWIYSAHDTTVANVLNALNLFDLHSPEYTACILMEMRLDDENQPLISMFYKNNTDVTNPAPLHIPGCGIACPLNIMFSLYKDVMPIDWEEECKVSTLLLTYEEANISLAMGILVSIISVMLVMSYLILIYYRRRSYKNHSSYSQVA